MVLLLLARNSGDALLTGIMKMILYGVVLPYNSLFQYRNLQRTVVDSHDAENMRPVIEECREVITLRLLCSTSELRFLPYFQRC